MNDTPATVTKELLDAYNASPAPIQKLILSDKFAAFTSGLATRFNLSAVVAATVADELLVFLLGSVPPNELLGQLLEIDDLDEGVAVDILEAFSKEIIKPLGEVAPARPTPTIAPINRLQTPPAPPKPVAPVAPKAAMSPMPAGKKMDIHPVEKHLELPPHETKAPVAPPTPKPRPYIPPPAPMRTMKTDVAANKQAAMPPAAPKPAPPAPPKPTPPPMPPKPPAPADAQKAPSDPYREPID